MICQEMITEEWIDQASKANNNADRLLVEKVIHAFLLLEGLAMSPLQFIFKGGTSLMMHFDSPKRLSIDIDILMAVEPITLEQALNDIAKRQGFSKVIPQVRNTASKIDKAHYKFFYPSTQINSNREESVLLDIVFASNPYTYIVPKEIQSSFLPYTGNLSMVNVPSVEDLLGDKLTAFAPNTTGVPYFKGSNSMSMEIMKQLFDIGCLFDASKDLQTIRRTFYRTVETELHYRDVEGGADAVLKDIFDTALCISTRGMVGNGDFKELQLGLKRVSGFIFSESFHIERAIVSASKAAYIATLIHTNGSQIERYEEPITTPIEDLGFTKLNKLQKTNPEAFFYWQRTTNLSAKRDLQPCETKKVAD